MAGGVARSAEILVPVLNKRTIANKSPERHVPSGAFSFTVHRAVDVHRCGTAALHHNLTLAGGLGPLFPLTGAAGSRESAAGRGACAGVAANRRAAFR